MVSKKILFATILEGNGFSATKPREFVFEAIEGKNGISMGDLVQLLEGKCNRASVYRSVELFEQLNIVSRISMGWKYKLELSELFQGHHHHATCQSCGRIIEFEETPEFTMILDQLSSALNFQINEHSLEVQGYCSNCQPDPGSKD
ncbi:transcriptional repressor [Candidatus Saccharibacteria bacterium]|jgi:Fur family ferric uptake transcriptional regulator|nr:transcriptional repressor [Candidatus Saccharibacteria bacterium]